MTLQQLRLAPTLIAVLLASCSTAAHTQAAANSPATPASQAAPAPIAFEVVSVHPHPFNGDEPSNRRVLPGGRFVATASTVRTLLRMSFGVDGDRISGAPHWVDEDMFDITASTANHTEIKTQEQLSALLKAMLQDRFGLQFHKAPKEVPVYFLELIHPGQTGPALKLDASSPNAGMSTNSDGTKLTMQVTNVTMDDIAGTLTRQAARPVKNRTGLSGKFDFVIEFASDGSTDSSIPTFFTVLKDELGLRLRPGKDIVDTISIDRISHPSEN